MKQCFSNLALEVIITKEAKWHLLCYRRDSSSGPVLIKTTIPSFCINQAPSTPANIMMRVKTMWLPCLLQRGPSVLQVENDIWLVSFVMYINFLVPILKSTAFIFPDILYFIRLFYHLSCKPQNIITFLICIIPKTSISLKQKKDISKRKKQAILIFLESLANKQQLFFIS